LIRLSLIVIFCFIPSKTIIAFQLLSVWFNIELIELISVDLPIVGIINVINISLLIKYEI
jgi:hypothetical protein